MRHLALATLALVAAAGCGVSKDEFAASQRDAASAKAQLQAETERATALEAKVKAQEEQLTAQAKELEAEKAKSAQQAEHLKVVEEEKGALAAKSAQYEQLTASLQSQIANGQVEISELRGKMMVKLKDRVLFASGSTALGKEGRAALDAVAAAFKDLKGKTILVAGYTDNVPTGANSGFTDNWDLSTARAVTVVRYLQSKGVPPVLLGAGGFSEYRPLASNETTQGRSQNRRIEIALTADDTSSDAVTAAPPPPAAKP